jgi:predicted esterase
MRRIGILALVSASFLLAALFLSWQSTLSIVAVVAVFLTPFAPRGRRLVWLASVGAIFGVLLVFHFLRGGDGRTIELRVVEKHVEARAHPADLLLSERDVSIAAATILVASGALPAADSAEFLPALVHAYDRMQAEEGEVGSPLLSTWLGGEGPDRFHLYTVAHDAPEPDRAVVFLHGFAGSFAVQCWHAARAFERFRATTHCPSVGFHGDWWTARGRRVLGAVLDDLEASGVERVVLVGLSNGARGAAVLARRFASRLDGVVVISGAAGVAPPRLPVLAIQGTDDTMFPARVARSYARAARNGTYAPIEGGHFVFLEDWEDVRSAVDRWIGSEL